MGGRGIPLLDTVDGGKVEGIPVLMRGGTVCAGYSRGYSRGYSSNNKVRGGRRFAVGFSLTGSFASEEGEYDGVAVLVGNEGGEGQHIRIICALLHKLPFRIRSTAFTKLTFLTLFGIV